MTIDFEEKKQEMIALGTELFNYLTTLPQDIRPDTEKRLGIAILLRIPCIRQLLEIHIGTVSSMISFMAAEKTVRTETNADKTSQDSEDIPNLKFGGCVTIYLEENNQDLHMSISGLKGGPEDASCALIMIARAADVSIQWVIDDIQQDGGKLPEEIFQEGHYLKELLDSYR
jgi:hypothetical protein